MSESSKLPLSPEQKAAVELDNFVSNPGLTEVAGLFGAEQLPTDNAVKLSTLQGLAAQHWDFRKGAERQATNWDDELLDQPGSAQWNTVFSASEKLGLVQNTEPYNKQPNSLVILGGANKAPLNRLQYGLDAVDGFDQVAFLGSSRKVSDTEREKAKDYAPEAQTEFDLGCGAFEKILNAVAVDEIKTMRGDDEWKMRIYRFEQDGAEKHGFVLSTPQKIGERRATTYDNYKFFAESMELDKDPDHTVVAVTTGHYTQGQHLPAVQELTLKHGTQVETIGHSVEYDAINPNGSGLTRKPSQLLQETKSAIDAAVRLEDAIRLQEAA
jgi:hypothetical protein